MLCLRRGDIRKHDTNKLRWLVVYDSSCRKRQGRQKCVEKLRLARAQEDSLEKGIETETNRTPFSPMGTICLVERGGREMLLDTQKGSTAANHRGQRGT